MPTTELTMRQQRIEDYIARSAVAVFLANVHHELADDDASENLEELGDELRVGLFDELFATDEAVKSSEFALVSARRNLLASRLFDALARNAGWCAEKAAHFRLLAEQELLTLSEADGEERGR